MGGAKKFLQKVAVGLDWAGSEVRVVEVQKGAPRPSILHAFVGHFEESPDVAVKKALALANISSTLVRVAIAGEGVVVRYLLLPSMKKEELQTALAFEVEKYIPYKGPEIHLDHQILGETHEKKLRVLMVAAKRVLIQALLSSFEKLQLQPVLIDVTGFAVCNVFLFNQVHPNPKEAVGVVHVEKELTSVNVLKESSAYFSRDISMGQTQIQSDPVFLGDLANEIRSTFDYYETQWSDSVKKVYLSGQVAQSDLESLTKTLGLEVSFWDPTRGFQIADSIRTEVEPMKPHLHLALGLAIREL